MSNFSGIELLVTIIGTLGTVSAAIAAARSAFIAEENTKLTKESVSIQQDLIEMESKPILIINNKSFETLTKFSDAHKAIHEKNWETNEYTILKDSFSKNVTINLINLGKGYAKDIEITWEIVNFENLIQVLNTKDTSEFYEELNIKIKEGKRAPFIYLTGSTTRIIAEDGFSSVRETMFTEYYLKSIRKEIYVYLAGNQNSCRIALPSCFICLVNLLSCLKLKDSMAIEKDDLPFIKMKISYKDSKEENYNDEYTIKIRDFNKSYPIRGEFTTHIKLLPEKL